jgi:hypothetical protein
MAQWRDETGHPSASLFSISLGEATSAVKSNMLSVHAYVMEEWERQPIVLGFFEVSCQLGHVQCIRRAEGLLLAKTASSAFEAA